MPLNLASPSTHHLQNYPTMLKEENKHIHSPREEAHGLALLCSVYCSPCIQCTKYSGLHYYHNTQGWKSSIQSSSFLFLHHLILIVLAAYVSILKSSVDYIKEQSCHQQVCLKKKNSMKIILFHNHVEKIDQDLFICFDFQFQIDWKMFWAKNKCLEVFWDLIFQAYKNS